ncbi:STAS domain-containing protein [Noviherbaspirillum galbum]|uniref:STAS domain-containing protein n=1 Tax=Noviherbaspirillum galbum TaxID=2709383 RepID=A0A6B3SKM9_9BURK|nr:STAS domain-containing protein [Noviherbaspirillum galbum]NEX61343.1 STAS domain-containing protein [Noviherbaspirillum galbum]
MGIFSLFGKKDRQQSPDDASSRAKKGGARSSAKPGARTPPKRDAQTALATAMKIDAIESEMSSDFLLSRAMTTIARTTQDGTPVPPVSSASSASSAPSPTPAAPAAPARSAKPAAPAPVARPPKPVVPAASSLDAVGDLPGLTDMGTTTQFLLGGSSSLGAVAVAESEVAAVVEEAAILFANGQFTLVEQLLNNAILDKQGDDMQSIWLMLFDLYQITGKHAEFDNLSIAYASRFERSPPAWAGSSARSGATGAAAGSGSSPAIPFSGRLDANARKQVDRVDKVAESYRALRLEFTRVTDVEPAGCRLLLDLLLRLQKSGHELVLVGAMELAAKVRATLEVGRQEDTEPGWLLLLEILRLLGQESVFEEVSIDYCVTFEVSPPAYVAPQNKVTTAAASAPAGNIGNIGGNAEDGECYKLPPVIDGRVDNLIVAIAAYSDEHSPAIIDCSVLTRIDFASAGRLMSGLAPFCGNGKTFEFHHVNHLVAALFEVIGLKDMVRVVPRKN